LIGALDTLDQGVGDPPLGGQVIAVGQHVLHVLLVADEVHETRDARDVVRKWAAIEPHQNQRHEVGHVVGGGLAIALRERVERVELHPGHRVRDLLHGASGQAMRAAAAARRRTQ
jgi:hypothetical protein